MAVNITGGKMRSPRYPVIGLGDAIERVRLVYEKDHLNTVPKEVVAEHMGYKTVNGASLGVISAVSKFGLLSGGADGMRVTDRALAILVHAKGDRERSSAIEAAAHAPALFAELFEEFPNGASDNAIKSFLLGRKKFLPAAVPVAIRAFKDTMAVVQEEVVDYETGDDDGPDDQEDFTVLQPQTPPPAAAPPLPPVGGFEIGFTGQAIRLLGNIGSQEEADKVLKAIEGLKFMLPARAEEQPN
ncbi:hypothetical protein [Sphingomonas solaris]|uniref:DUF5343 domain-containing protein n=1 Tax=Alterirhizorhabdus solaris TaxID=2529389 RepID=A0A558RB45_9SPHN|nr:hypothetical protein [Sphingomonas solaris]TVV76571.1 hypothetical protein FOY91_04070 [Sphingomonas solaris]